MRIRLNLPTGIVLLILVTRSFPMARAAAPIKLNASGPAGDGQFSPDGSKVLYESNNSISIVPSSGGAPITLSPPMVSGGNFLTLPDFSPDGGRVLYWADQDVDQKYEIYSVPSVGGTAVKLNLTLPDDGDTTNSSLAFSPDGSRVLYSATLSSTWAYDLYSVPSSGGTSVLLSPQLGYQQYAYFAKFSPDSSRVIYVSNQEQNNRPELYSVPSIGGTPVKLNSTLPAGAKVDAFTFQFSPDGSRALYLADQDTLNYKELYSVPSAGGTPVRINTQLAANGGYVSGDVKFSADGADTFFDANLQTGGLGIYKAPIAGGSITKLTGPIGNGAYYWELSHNRDRLMYVADSDNDGQLDIYTVPTTGGAPLEILHAFATPQQFNSGSAPRFTPDDSRVLYFDKDPGNSAFNIYSVPSTGGSFVRLNKPIVAGGAIAAPYINVTPDGRRIIYQADQDTLDVEELFIVPAKGGIPVRINAPLVMSGDVSPYETRVSPDGSRVIYNADQEVDGVNNVYMRVIEAKWTGGNGSWDTATKWNNGVVPDEVIQTDITAAAIITAAGSTARKAFTVDVGGAGFASTLELQTGASIAVTNGITVHDNGSICGNGLIIGEITVLSGGRLAPGGNAGLLQVTAANFDPGSTLEIELGGIASASYDHLVATGALRLGGTLQLSLINSFSPVAGNSFDILDWSSRTGNFAAVVLPALAPGLMWNASQLNFNGTIGVSIAGDYNANGTVDAADYVLWRKIGGSQDDYNTWRANIGRTLFAGAGSGASPNAAVPEPSPLLLLIMVAAGQCCLRGRRISNMSETRQRMTHAS
jgi:Tol biopolymer transport system component